MIDRRWVGLGAWALTLTACGGETTVASFTPPPAPSHMPTATATPTSRPPSIDPAHMTLDVTLSFKLGATALGDPIETVTYAIASNSPQNFEAYVALTVQGQFVAAAGSCGELAVGCIMRPNQVSTGAVFWRGRAPAGSYRLVVDVPSYSSTPLGGQESSYTAWVGGPQGPNLAGNPLAVHDANHPAVLNLRREVVTTH